MNGSIMFRLVPARRSLSPKGRPGWTGGLFGAIFVGIAFSQLARQRFFGAFWLIVMFVLTFADCFTRDT